LQTLRAQRVFQDSPNPILGHPVGDDSRWRSCKLAHTILTRQQLNTPKSSRPHTQTAEFAGRPLGLSDKEYELLFEQLPEVSAQLSFLEQPGNDPLEWTGSNSQPPDLIKFDYLEQHKAYMLARTIDLRNSNADGLAFENRKRIVTAFSSPSQPQNTGRPEVQGASIPFHTPYNLPDLS
jgi:small subunit ribosomal protein S15